MGNSAKCWASFLGECSGPITEEHLFTEALFKDRVTIKGNYTMPDGSCPEWLTEQGLDMHIKKLSLNILCEKHNKDLGKTADRAAIDLQRALQFFNKPKPLKGSRIFRSPKSVKISGVNFARWLCKTHCNIMVANGSVPNRSYVQYAFGYRPDQILYFYTPTLVGQKLPISKGHVNYVVYVDCQNPNIRIFKITLAGLNTLVTTFAIDVKKTANLMKLDASFLNRLKCIQQRTQLGWYRIHLNWDNDPCVRPNNESGTTQRPGN
jgi:hypothetical protein